jgi:hypothetical protein
MDNKFDRKDYDNFNGYCSSEDDDDDDYGYDNYDDACDLNSTKLCDSCGECLELNKNNFRIVRIEGVAPRDFEVDEYILDEETLDKDDNIYENNTLGVEYIEDIPELREEYDKKINKLLGRE